LGERVCFTTRRDLERDLAGALAGRREQEERERPDEGGSSSSRREVGEVVGISNAPGIP
jgi:hypothetical protein